MKGGEEMKMVKTSDLNFTFYHGVRSQVVSVLK